MKRVPLLLFAAIVVSGCISLPEPRYSVAEPGAPVELTYREGKGGLVLLAGRVNGKADVEFVLDTGAPVTVLLDGKRTKALGLDSSRARPLGDGPASPKGDLQAGFHLEFAGLTLSELSAVVVPQASMPCQEKFDEIGFGGVIGADVFRRFVAEIDPAPRRVRLHDPGVWRAPRDAAVVPIEFRSGHPFVNVRVVLGDGAVVEAAMHLDTGMNSALSLTAGAHPALAMPAAGKPRNACLVNGVREQREGAPLTVELGGMALAVAAPIYSAAPNVVDGSRSGTVGAQLFAGRRIFIDYPGRRLFIER